MSGLLTLLALWVLLGAIWVAVWPFFSGERETIDPRLLELRELETEKARLVDELHEIELDYETGKLSDEDFERQRARLKARAVEVMREIDEREKSALAHRSKKARKKEKARSKARAR
ncbi:MAG: hypothetical protein R3326_07495 [Gemmatimonadota bacterium]|nr:hypothetical protein [Gemmatimonadota bacterium]